MIRARERSDMLAQLWSGGYLLDWTGLVFEFLGAALAAFGILPAARNLSTDSDGNVRLATAFLMLQTRQVRAGLFILAFGCLLETIATFQAAMPLFAK
jgi:hypothetical protein